MTSGEVRPIYWCRNSNESFFRVSWPSWPDIGLVCSDAKQCYQQHTDNHPWLDRQLVSIPCIYRSTLRDILTAFGNLRSHCVLCPLDIHYRSITRTCTRPKTNATRAFAARGSLTLRIQEPPSRPLPACLALHLSEIDGQRQRLQRLLMRRERRSRMIILPNLRPWGANRYQILDAPYAIRRL